MSFNIIKYWVKNTLRNKFLSISSILVISLLMFFVNILVILHSVSESVVDDIKSRLTITLFLKDEYNSDSSDLKLLVENLESISDNLEVTYKSKEEGFSDLKEKKEWIWEIFWWLNPLPNTIQIANIDTEEYELVNREIENKMYIIDESWFWWEKESATSYRSQFKEIQELNSVITSIQAWLYFLIWVFVLSISVIIYSVISNFVYYYKDEIHITKLVWWDKKYIYWPFSVQWAIYSLSALVISFWFFVLALENVRKLFDWISLSTTFIVWLNLWELFLIEFTVFILLWLFSWFYSSKKYLK